MSHSAYWRCHTRQVLCTQQRREEITMIDTLPRTQDATCGLGMNPVEGEMARCAVAQAYCTLMMLREAGHFDLINTYGGDPKAVEQCEETIANLEDLMSPNLLLTVLPAYSRVEFATNLGRPGQIMKGLVRDGAWGLYPCRSGATERRITTEAGFEFFSDSETVFTYFRVLERK